MEQTQSSSIEYRILALYRFVPLVSSPNNASISADVTLQNLQKELYEALRPLQVRGTLLIAPEGINGTICYPFTPTSNGADKYGNDLVFTYLKGHSLFGGPDLRTRLSVWGDFCQLDNDTDLSSDEAEKKIQQLKQPQQAFQRLKIKIKAEIVTMGLGRPLFRDGKALQSNEHESYTCTSAQTSSRHHENQKCNPLLTKGQYLSPQQWDEAVQNPDVLVIDTRNTYEIDIGTFDGAIDPKTKHFAEFPDYLEKLANEYNWTQEGAAADVDTPNDNVQKQEVNTTKQKPPQAIAMFCTGGIRCEKATSYALQSNLFPKIPIYHLEGGILAYLDYVSKKNEAKDDSREDEKPKSTFHGECFVFDKRVAVTEGCKPSKNYIPCYGCRGPVDKRLLIVDAGGNVCRDNGNATESQPSIPSKYQTLMEGIPNLPQLTYDGQTKSWYLPGLTCPRCHNGTTRESLERFAQRKEQMEICAREGKSHFKDARVNA